MKQCIWCRQKEDITTFNKLAHTIPQSLGGKHICINVCDKCNAYFGNPQAGKPSIEAILKEALGISRFHLLNTGATLKRGNPAGRYKSNYFDVNFKGKNHTIRLKPSYSYRPNFQDLITRQFKRGLYKVFLEELERQRGNALDDKYNFIREFARYDLGDYPVLHFERSFGALYYSNDWIIHPQMFMDKQYRSDDLLEEYGFFEFEILGHIFSVVTSKLWHLTFDIYAKKSLQMKQRLFDGYRVVKQFDDIDLTLNRAFSED